MAALYILRMRGRDSDETNFKEFNGFVIVVPHLLIDYVGLIHRPRLLSGWHQPL